MSPAATELLAHIGRVARERREALGVTLADLAPMAGLYRSTLSRIERGEAPNVSCPTLMALANALGLSLSDLMGQPASADGVSPAEMKVVLTLRQGFTERAQ